MYIRSYQENLQNCLLLVVMISVILYIAATIVSNLTSKWNYYIDSCELHNFPS